MVSVFYAADYAAAARIAASAGFSAFDLFRAFDRFGRHMCPDDAAAMEAVEGRAVFAPPGPSRFGK